jgi:hypothetical protein
MVTANFMKSTNSDLFLEDGYVGVGNDGYTVVTYASTSGTPVTSLIKSWQRTAAGLWTATFRHAWPTNLQWFHVDPQLARGDSPSYLEYQLQEDNVGTTGTVAGQQYAHFMFHQAGVATDLAPHSGFKYSIGVQNSTAYYTQSY